MKHQTAEVVEFYCFNFSCSMAKYTVKMSIEFNKLCTNFYFMALICKTLVDNIHMMQVSKYCLYTCPRTSDFPDGQAKLAYTCPIDMLVFSCLVLFALLQTSEFLYWTSGFLVVLAHLPIKLIKKYSVLTLVMLHWPRKREGQTWKRRGEMKETRHRQTLEERMCESEKEGSRGECISEEYL